MSDEFKPPLLLMMESYTAADLQTMKQSQELLAFYARSSYARSVQTLSRNTG
jgi:hypothetical protein